MSKVTLTIVKANLDSYLITKLLSSPCSVQALNMINTTIDPTLNYY